MYEKEQSVRNLAICFQFLKTLIHTGAVIGLQGRKSR